MNRQLKIAHTSDVHLNDGDDGMPVRHAFAEVVDTVLEIGADLFLIAGDLFDHTRIEGDVIDFVYEQLARVACPTVLIAGNHDVWQERSVLQRMDFRQAGKHVSMLDEPEGMMIELPELHTTVWGRCMLDHAPNNRPMKHSPPRTRDLWHIGMAHGLYMDDPESERSSLITPQEIAASGFDYLALGHVHAHLGTRETGSMAIVDLVPGKPAKVTERPVHGKAKRHDARPQRLHV